ncbi:fused MFS/spermidine synthase [Serratia microhaemolytica]|uniref:fused MFS/spermidine synthase n=1 Tax=Serratia microhaemolytica TaxID=2675110 RepID=UPI000FDF06EF|nr:fused MFS/spermidine synthase [Serratia microhaemolytica]
MLSVIMFMNGLCLMVLEMVGARLLAPWLGTSTVVWTSLIGVILAFLSLGYWLGGKLADSLLSTTTPATQTADNSSKQQLNKARSVLARLLFCAGVTVLLTAVLQQPLLSWLTTLTSTLHVSAVLAAILLFALPGLLSGMVSPFTMRLAITSQSSAGSTIGRLNAIATVGSIVGTFLGGFVLISWFGSREIVLAIAICYLLVALCTYRLSLRNTTAAVAIFAVAFIIEQKVALSSNNMITLETRYNTLRIADGFHGSRPARYMITDPGSAQSGTYLDSPEDLVFEYTYFYQLASALAPQANNVLMLGGGGYSVPKWLLSSHGPLGRNAHLDVVELDPGISQAAADYFFAPVNDPRLHIHHEDARVFINRQLNSPTPPSYDLIFTDVFNSHYFVPFHVGTRESAAKMRALLKPDGIVMMNIISAIEGDNGRLLRGIYHAFRQEFAEVMLIPVNYPGSAEEMQNVMLMAFATKGTVNEQVIANLPPYIAAMYSVRWRQPVSEDIPALVDNFAPVERYMLGFLNR